jgi:hypothetical protein
MVADVRSPACDAYQLDGTGFTESLREVMGSLGQAGDLPLLNRVGR